MADLTNLAGAPLATGDPFGYVFGSPLIVYKVRTTISISCSAMVLRGHLRTDRFGGGCDAKLSPSIYIYGEYDYATGDHIRLFNNPGQLAWDQVAVVESVVQRSRYYFRRALAYPCQP